MDASRDDSQDKYYVQCGRMRYLVLAEDPYEAARKAVNLALLADQVLIDHMIYVDQQGFRSGSGTGESCISTSMLGTTVSNGVGMPSNSIPLEEILESL